MGNLIVVGLGPGDASLLTVEARDAIAAAPAVWLRTARHPTIAGLPDGPCYESFDHVYESAPSFEAVYEAIVARVLELAARPEGAVYAVPGHPLFGEATVRSLLLRARDAGVTMRIIAGVSFLDTMATALGLDPLTDGLLILDALSLGIGRTLTPERPTVIAQVYDQRAASQAKLALLNAYPPDHPVRIVRAAGAGGGAIIETTLARLDHEDAFDHLATLYLPPVALTANVRSFEGLRAVVARLRAPEGGCPWDLEQTHQTLKRFLLEEAYEALDALDAGEPHKLAEELGDLLMQVMLHAQVAEDEDEFVIEDVIASITSKLVRRHPHVFGDVRVQGSADVLRNWDELKKQERDGAPLLDPVPKAMPALAQAQSVQSRASKAGMGPQRVAPDAVTRLLQALTAATNAVTAAQLGEVLFGIVALARERGLDAEESLRMTVRQFRDEVSTAERETAAPS